jgi:protein SCO1
VPRRLTGHRGRLKGKLAGKPWVGALALWACVLAWPLQAAVAPRDYRDVGVSVSNDAGIPLDAEVTDDSGHRRALGELVSRPTVLVFADYTCRTLCGPVVAFVASALEKSGLRPLQDFRLIVVGLDPKDSPADAARMRRDHLGHSSVNSASTFVTADAPTIERLTGALGYRYAYDQEHDQYVHPGAAFVLRSDGRVARVLTGLGLSGADMRLALVEAGEGRIGTIADDVRLLCSGFDPEHGMYNVAISRILAAATFATVLLLGGGIGLLVLLERRRRMA